MAHPAAGGTPGRVPAVTGALAEAERRRRWAAALVAVDAWIRRNGGLYPLPPVDMKMPDGRSLHSWILNARQAYRYGELARWQVETAEAVDGWTWATRRRRRSDTGRTKPGQLARVGLLKAWTDVHGPLPAAGPLTGDDDGELAGIRDRLRTHRRGAERGRYRPLAADVIAAADALPGWTWEIQPSGPRVGAVSPYQRALVAQLPPVRCRRGRGPHRPGHRPVGGRTAPPWPRHRPGRQAPAGAEGRHGCRARVVLGHPVRPGLACPRRDRAEVPGDPQPVPTLPAGG